MTNRTEHLLIVALLFLLLTGSARAFTFRLEGGPVSEPFGGQGAVATQDTSALYALDSNGHEVILAKIGSRDTDGFLIDDLGFPAVADDGTVYFAAGTFERGNLFWRMFLAHPESGESPLPLQTTDGGRNLPEMNVDPRPLPDGQGGVVFIAPDIDGHDTVFRLAHGHLAAVASTGTATRDGRIVRRITFGTIDSSGEDVAFTGWLDRGGQAEMLVSPRGITVLATERSKAPGGGEFLTNGLGHPAAVRAGKQTLVAFAASTSRGDALFLYRDGNLKRVLAAGDPCPNGRLNYLSPEKPGLLADGTVAALGGCSGTRVLLTSTPRAALNVALEAGHHNSDHFVSVGNPFLVNSGAIVFDGYEGDGNSGIYSLATGRAPIQIAPPAVIEGVSAVNNSKPRAVYTEAVAVSRLGHLAYLR